MATQRRTRGRTKCNACWQTGHNRATCTAPLLVWTNGPDLMIAASAERCARIFNDPLGADSEPDLYSKPEHWKRVDEDPIALDNEGRTVSRPAKDWIWIAREGFLTIDGKLAASIFAPRRAGAR